MPSCNDTGTFQTDENYKASFKYVAPGYCWNTIAQTQYINEEYGNPCHSNQTNAIYCGKHETTTHKYYKQKCMVGYETSLPWVGGCGQGSVNMDCNEPEAFCKINNGQRAMDIIPNTSLMIKRSGDDTNWNYKDTKITAALWNRVYEILQTMFNFPLSNNSNDTDRRGKRTPFIYELVRCSRGDQEEMWGGQRYIYDEWGCHQVDYHKWIDGRGWCGGLWRYSEVVPSYQSIINRINNSNGALSLVYLKNKWSNSAPQFGQYYFSNQKNWENDVKNEIVYIRHTLMVDNNNNITGVAPGDEVMFNLFNEILGVMDVNTGTITQGTKITEDLMRMIQNNIFNFEFEPDRCRYCNTNCNDGKCQEEWQAYSGRCDEGGGCTAMYGCMCYFQGHENASQGGACSTEVGWL